MMGFNSTVKDLIDDVDRDVLAKVNVSRVDRNWDSLKALWRLKEEVKASAELRGIFLETTQRAEFASKLDTLEAGRALLGHVADYAKECGYKAVYTHEYDVLRSMSGSMPILEQIKSFLASDFDCNAIYDKCIREQDAAIASLRNQIASKSVNDQKRFEEALRSASAHVSVDTGPSLLFRPGDVRPHACGAAEGRAHTAQGEAARRSGGHHVPRIRATAPVCRQSGTIPAGT
jgi:hypothetical protein